MNPHQRDSRQAAELAFVEALNQLEQQLMADEAEACDDALASESSTSPPQDWENYPQISSPSQGYSESQPSSRDSSSTTRPSTSTGSDFYRQPRSPQPLSNSKRAPSSAPRGDTFQAFADAADDIERFIQSRQ
ncbi:MAG: hypothetical protein WBA57_03030 [Elainellaceae cyanobacterium]